MLKVTMKEFVKLADIDILKEIYAKLVALRQDYLIHNRTHFNPEYFENLYHEAANAIEKAKMTKLQICAGIVNQSQELELIGFNRQDLLKLAGLDIK